MKRIALMAAAWLGGASIAQAAGWPSGPGPALESVLAQGAALAGQTQLIDFVLALSVNDTFTVTLGEAKPSQVSFALFQGSTAWVPTVPSAGLLSSLVIDYDGMQAGQAYTLQLTSSVDTTWTISSLNLAAPPVTVSAVPEAGTAWMALVGLGGLVGIRTLWRSKVGAPHHRDGTC